MLAIITRLGANRTSGTKARIAGNGTTTASSDYEVYLIPRVPLQDDTEHVRDFSADGLYSLKPKHLDTTLAASEWPPASFILNVFSSVTGQWEERLFNRDGEAAGTVADMRLDDSMWFCHRRAVYYRAALYVHCEHFFVTRYLSNLLLPAYIFFWGFIHPLLDNRYTLSHACSLCRFSLLDNRCQVIKPPSVDFYEYPHPQFHLGRSEKGVYYALLDRGNRLRVWNLDESEGNMEWQLNHDSVCSLVKPSLNFIQKVHGPWTLRDVNCNNDKETEPLVEQKSEWNSDDENILHCEDDVRLGP